MGARCGPIEEVEDPIEVLKEVLALMDNGERNYDARARVAYYLRSLRDSGVTVVRKDAS